MWIYLLCINLILILVILLLMNKIQLLQPASDWLPCSLEDNVLAVYMYDVHRGALSPPAGKYIHKYTHTPPGQYTLY